jgi:hypothetical protein
MTKDSHRHSARESASPLRNANGDMALHSVLQARSDEETSGSLSSLNWD